jgi:hypothetical protein
LNGGYCGNINKPYGIEQAHDMTPSVRFVSRMVWIGLELLQQQDIGCMAASNVPIHTLYMERFTPREGVDRNPYLKR